MKKGLLILILGVSLLFTGCSSNSLDRLNKNILKMFNDINYVEKGLTPKEKKLIENFKESQKAENLVIELNDSFNEYNRTNNPDTNGIWQEDGIYYIKYKDIIFEDYTNDSDNDTGYDTLAVLYCNGYEIYLTKESIPVLYYDTKDVKKYNYSYVKKEEKNNEIDVYYRSYYDTTGIIIRYIKKGNEIDDIKLKYVDVMPYDVEPVEESSGTTIIAVSVVTFGIGLALVVSYAIKKIKSSRIM